MADECDADGKQNVQRDIKKHASTCLTLRPGRASPLSHPTSLRSPGILLSARESRSCPGHDTRQLFESRQHLSDIWGQSEIKFILTLDRIGEDMSSVTSDNLGDRAFSKHRIKGLTGSDSVVFVLKISVPWFVSLGVVEIFSLMIRHAH
jgi:hypothetical protein